MAFFAVLSTTENEKLNSLIKSTFKDEDIKALPNSCYLISFKGSASEFVKKLNLDGKSEGCSKELRPCEGIIIPFNSYAGYADSDIWSWLNERRI